MVSATPAPEDRSVPQVSAVPVSAAIAVPAPTGRSLTLAVDVLLLALGAAYLCYYAADVAQATRLEALAAVQVEIVAWALGMIALAAAHPSRQLRISDPGVLVLGWCMYYFIMPALSFLKGRRFALEHPQIIELTSGVVSHVQYLHVLFMLSFVLAYLSVMPRIRVQHSPPAGLRGELPSGRALVLLGLLPTLWSLGERLLTTGSLRPDAYDALNYRIVEDIGAARSLGGGDYALVQMASKLWYFPLMALGVGAGLAFVRAAKNRDWRFMVLFHGAVPVLLYLSGGGRSAVYFPFMIALLLADLLIGPISRRYLAAVVVSGTLFFNFYGVFRQHQNQDLGSALTATVDESQRYEAMERGEEAAMIVKDAYAVTYTDAVGTIMSYDYYPRSALNLLPLQVIPSKRQWVQGATFLSGELLRTDYRDYGSGVAGAIIADGYMMDHERGVLVLSLVLGVLAAFVSRWLLLPRRGAAGPRLWAIAIYAATLVQMANYVRGDLATIVMYLTYYTLFPWALLSFVRWRTDSPWHQELALRR